MCLELYPRFVGYAVKAQRGNITMAMQEWRRREAKWNYALLVIYGVLVVCGLAGYLMGWAVPI